VSTISPAKKDLWLRLRGYHFEHLVPAHLADHVMAAFGGPDAATRAFATKLTRKLGWSPRFARRAIEEYRKFLYLGSIADFGVTPSKIIDQVWHEHLLFTKGYQEFCDHVLGRPFEHYPELMSTEAQTAAFESQYDATLDLYETEFNTAPPDDIWSTPKFRKGLARAKREPRKRADWSMFAASSPADDAPLYVFFDGTSASGGQSFESMPEFGGGGGFSGGGGGDSWGDSSSDSSGSSSDSGSGSDGGSGCSSGCGGGGCGGGGE